MPKKIYSYFYLSLIFSIIGLIFPTHVSQAIGFDIGDMVHWVYGFYILIPRNPVGEPQFYFTLQIQGLFLIVCAGFLVVVFFVELRNAKLGNHYDKNLIYVIAIIQLIASQFYQFTGLIVMQLSSWGFIFSAIFTLIGNKELNLFYIDKGIINVKKERKVGIVLITISLISIVYCISIFLCCVAPYGTDAFSSLFVIDMFPSLILLLLMLIYGIYSLIRAKRMKKSKLQ
jgi:hypothetical protein